MGLLNDMRDIKAQLSDPEGMKAFYTKFVEMLNKINANLIIVQENQIEIGKRLARIEDKLNIPDYKEPPQIGKL
jgi:hypothetical protein